MAISQINSNSLASGVPASSNMPVGSVLQVVNASYGTEVAFTSTSYSDTGLTASITPTKASSKILVLVSQSGCGKDGGNTRLGLQLLRGATVIVTNVEKSAAYSADSGGSFVGGVSACYLDSPATTSSTTYKTQGNSFSAPGNGSSRTQQDNVVSTITLMEIAA
jgi:hypothetical protein